MKSSSSWHLIRRGAWRAPLAWRLLLGSSLLALLGFLPPAANAQTGGPGCGELQNSFGPYDYRKHAGSQNYKTDSNNPLRLVEIAHFRPEMEALRQGGQGPLSTVGPEFDYTLRAFPNHHRALDAILRLSARDRTDQPKGMRYTISCWFERAVRFVPDDPIVRMLFATYLGKTNRVEEALQHLAFAAKSNADNAFTQYNVGLAYFDMKQFDLALKQAHISYGMGMQRLELKELLTQSGHWRDLPAGGTPANAASAPATN